MQRTLSYTKSNVNFEEYYYQLSFRLVIFFSDGDSFFLFAPFPPSSAANWGFCSLDVMSSGSIYIKHQKGSTRTTCFIIMTSLLKIVTQIASKGFSPKYIFHHRDVSFKNSNMDNIKEYVPQYFDHQKYGHGDWINV